MQTGLLGAENKQAFLHRTPANRLETPWGIPSPKKPAGKIGGLGGRKLRWNNAIVIPPCGPPAGNNLSCLSAEKREDNSKNFPQIRRSRLPAQAGTPPPVAPGAGRVAHEGGVSASLQKANGQLPPEKPAPHQVLVLRPGNKQAFFAVLRYQPLGNTANRPCFGAAICLIADRR